MIVTETGRSPELQGVILKDAVRKRMLDVSANHLTPNKPKHSVITTMLAHLDELPQTVWSRSRSKAEINSVVPSAYGAFHHAYGMRTNKYLYEASLTTPADYEGAWQDVFNRKERSLYFDEYFWRPPVTFLPGRVPPFYYIAQDYYERHKEPLAIVDLGAGPGYFSSFLNNPKSRVLCGEPAGKDVIERKFRGSSKLPIVSSVNVDRNPEVVSYNWARYNTEDASRAALLNTLSSQSFHGSTNLLLDVTNFDYAAEQIHEALRFSGEIGGANIAVSSFSRHQLKPRTPEEAEFLQEDFKWLVRQVLRDGGIWIDVGEEMLGNDLSQWYKVHVYEKKGKILEPKGTPFVIADDGTVLDIDLSYFKS